MLVSAAKRPAGVIPIQVPPACRSRPANNPGASSQGASGSVGRVWNSSRLAATTRGTAWDGRQAKTIRHIGVDKGDGGWRLDEKAARVTPCRLGRGLASNTG